MRPAKSTRKGNSFWRRSCSAPLLEATVCLQQVSAQDNFIIASGRSSGNKYALFTALRSDLVVYSDSLCMRSGAALEWTCFGMCTTASQLFLMITISYRQRHYHRSGKMGLSSVCSLFTMPLIGWRGVANLGGLKLGFKLDPSSQELPTQSGQCRQKSEHRAYLVN
jgi:hypothetical protein